MQAQPNLDPKRVVFTGSSYGGYMALLAATNFENRIQGVISDSGPSNLVSFLENTEAWRRDMRRAEYGDERDPNVRTALENAAPRNNAARIKVPVLIFQGANDPRVRPSESESLVKLLKQRDSQKQGGGTVWYVLAKDEGHSFFNWDNQKFQRYVTVSFLKRFLLSEPTVATRGDMSHKNQ